jgi:hypothetical protein
MPIMNTLLVTTQIVAYGVGIVSASLNIAAFMRRRARWRRRSTGRRGRARTP